MEDLKHRLEIAAAIEGTSRLALSKKFGISHTQLDRVASGKSPKSPARPRIEEFINRAEKKYIKEILMLEAV